MPGPTRIALVICSVALAFSSAPLDVFANEVFSGECDTCHDHGDGGPTGVWHNRHLGQPCIGLDCSYCHSGTTLDRGHCNECHRGPGTANHHDCSGASANCITCHTALPSVEGTDYTPCLSECADGLDNDGNCAYDTGDVDCAGGGSCTAGAQASTYGPNPVYATPDLLKHTVPLFFLAGALLLWRALRRKK